jgi:DNA replication and repair protein RecF
LFKLNNISLVQFRNYSHARFAFSRNITGICGKNGSGKTNLLDAVYYLCFTKSYFGKTDIQSAQQGKTGFRLDGEVALNGKTYETTCILRENGKKEFSVNHENYTKFSAHIGRFPCVMIAPDDVAVITQASDERRKFIDHTMSQLDAAYLQRLIDYNKLLLQRNSLLKQLADSGVMDESLMEVISDQLAEAGSFIYTGRKQFLEQFIPVVIALYHSIAEHKEKLTITYRSSLESADFKTILSRNRAKDTAIQRTSEGVHRDDLEFCLEGYPFKATASQGQRKSLLFALKLAAFNALKEHTGFPPVLLLDDVFEKLDEARMKNLLFKVCVENKGQVFITDTHCSRLEEALQHLQADYDMITL